MGVQKQKTITSFKPEINNKICSFIQFLGFISKPGAIKYTAPICYTNYIQVVISMIRIEAV